jgi:hypothetical protein
MSANCVDFKMTYTLRYKKLSKNIKQQISQDEIYNHKTGAMRIFEQLHIYK